jgi:hypothetical protein
MANAYNRNKNPSMAGYLLRRGVFKDWNMRYVELKDNVISYAVIKMGFGYGSIKLTAKSRCEESSIRSFCFLIEDGVTGECVYFAANSVANKESWIEQIQAALSLLRLAERKKLRESRRDAMVHMDRVDKVLNTYQQRPLIYVKIIQARNLEAKDIGGTSDPYVKITLGSSTVRTTTRQKNLNPDWGMVFPMDWDRSMRYIKVEVWDEDYTSADDFLGSVFIPVGSFYDGYNSQRWYRLGKRSSKSNVRGEIEIEIAVTGQPNPDQLTW